MSNEYNICLHFQQFQLLPTDSALYLRPCCLHVKNDFHQHTVRQIRKEEAAAGAVGIFL